MGQNQKFTGKKSHYCRKDVFYNSGAAKDTHSLRRAKVVEAQQFSSKDEHRTGSAADSKGGLLDYY